MVSIRRRTSFTLASLCGLPLLPGAYYVGAVVRDAATSHVIDWWDGGTTLYVDAGQPAPGQFFMPHTWRIVHADSEARQGTARTRR